MKRETFFVIAAIVTGVFALGFLLVPDAVMSLYGTSLDTLSRFLCRYFANALAAIAVILYLGRNAKTVADFFKAVLTGGLLMCILGVIVSIWDGIAGVHTTFFVWVNVIVYAGLGIGFGYYYFVKKAA